MKEEAQNRRSGQAMLIAVLSLGGAILGATAVAGLLTLYQIRATTDTQNSAKAIFAADAGTEWALFSYYCAPAKCTGLPPKPVFNGAGGSGATLTVNCYATPGGSGPVTACNNTSTASAISTGVSNSAERAFFVGVSGASSTYYP